MSKLQPVTIVDKNGRTTTVHRRDATNSSVGTSLPSPKLSPQNGTQGTPLQPIIFNTASQTKQMLAAFSNGPTYYNVDSSMVSSGLSKRDKAITKRMLDNPDFNSELVKKIVSYGLWNEPTYPEEITANLLIAEKIIMTGDGSILKNNASTLYEIIIGMDQRHNRSYLTEPNAIQTEEELAGKAAIASFVLKAWLELPHDGSVYNVGNKQADFRWNRDFKIISNKHLHDLIMERPADQHRIMEYVRLRGMHSTNKTPVKALRVYLDEGVEATAVSSGWL